jgi:hypothetical protein
LRDCGAVPNDHDPYLAGFAHDRPTLRSAGRTPLGASEKTPVCYLKAASKHVTFGFWHGASINDPSGRLETSGEVMAHA